MSDKEKTHVRLLWIDLLLIFLLSILLILKQVKEPMFTFLELTIFSLILLFSLNFFHLVKMGNKEQEKIHIIKDDTEGYYFAPLFTSVFLLFFVFILIKAIHSHFMNYEWDALFELVALIIFGTTLVGMIISTINGIKEKKLYKETVKNKKTKEKRTKISVIGFRMLIVSFFAFPLIGLLPLVININISFQFLIIITGIPFVIGLILAIFGGLFDLIIKWVDKH